VSKEIAVIARHRRDRESKKPQAGASQAKIGLEWGPGLRSTPFIEMPKLCDTGRSAGGSP
jgi:hypothetical protein